jgi:hypothetical protein
VGHHRIATARRGIVAVAIAVAVLAGSASSFAVSAPDPTQTPGATDPRVTQDTLATTICTRGYTTTVRNVSTQTKHAVYVAYGISTAQQRSYVIDHLIPLEVGGANDPKNLWPEPKVEAKTKDTLENQMHTAVCAGRISLADAQARFVVATPDAVPAPAVAPPIVAPPAPAPTPTAPPAPGTRVVHPGAFCAPPGATGVTNVGTAMVCGPASDGRNRWHSA